MGEPAQSKHGEFVAETVKVGTTTRQFRLVVPNTVGLAKPSTVIAFPGMLVDRKEVMPKYTKLNGTTEKYKLVLVYPEAVGRSSGIDPVYFDALLGGLSMAYRIAADRVYVLGLSNGGYW